MLSLTTLDLTVHFIAALFFPLIIVLNLIERSRQSTPISVMVWTKYATLMLTAIAFMAILSVYAMIQLAAHYGLVPATAADAAMPYFGIAMAIMSVATIVVVIRAVHQAVTAR